MAEVSIDELDEGQLLVRAGDLHAQRRAAEVEIFLLAAHFADLHNPDSRPAGGRALPGMERAVRIGGAGTPAMWEFAVAQLAARLECSTTAARYLIRDALDTRHRLPATYARVRAGRVKISYVRALAQATHHLTAAAAGFVDAGVVDQIDGRIPWSRFVENVAGLVVAADPDAAARREAAEAARQFAKATRSTEHGIRGFYIRSTAGMIARFDATVAFLADALKALGDPDNTDQRRLKACLLMANPAQAVELLHAFAQYRADTYGHPTTDGVDDELPLDDDTDGDDDADDVDDAGDPDDERPIGEGDLHPSQNDADDEPEAATDRWWVAWASCRT